MDKKNSDANHGSMWPLFPAAAYLLAFLIIVLAYLLGLSFSSTAKAARFSPR